MGVPAAGTPDEDVYLPGRNVLLLSKSLLWCHLHGVPEVAMAPLAANPFPDATPEFFETSRGAVNRAVGGDRPGDQALRSPAQAGRPPARGGLAARTHLLVHPPGERPPLRPVQQVSRTREVGFPRRGDIEGPDRCTRGSTMFRVTKEIHFCYGHRLLNYAGKCRNLHGHNGKAVITLETPALDGLGMVVDFTEIKRVIGAWIDETLDHKMILHRDDPALPELHRQGEPVVVIDVNPTAENIAKLIYDHAAANGLPVTEVTLWETETSFATYRRG